MFVKVAEQKTNDNSTENFEALSYTDYWYEYKTRHFALSSAVDSSNSNDRSGAKIIDSINYSSVHASPAGTCF